MIRAIFARNVKGLRDERFPKLRTDTAKNLALAKAAGTTLSQVQRILARTLGTSIDLVESLAGVFGVRPQDLLTPYYADKRDQLEATPPLQDGGQAERRTLQRRRGRADSGS